MEVHHKNLNAFRRDLLMPFEFCRYTRIEFGILGIWHPGSLNRLNESPNPKPQSPRREIRFLEALNP